jgi:ribonuclease T1
MEFRNATLIMMLVIMAMSASSAEASTPKKCGKLPSYVVEAGRDFRICITGPATPGINCGPTGFDMQVFDNDLGRLPKAGKGQVYYEGKIRQPNVPGPGTKRWVDLTELSQGKTVIKAQYYTPDHYITFCTY